MLDFDQILALKVLGRLWCPSGAFARVSVFVQNRGKNRRNIKIGPREPLILCQSKRSNYNISTIYFSRKEQQYITFPEHKLHLFCVRPTVRRKLYSEITIEEMKDFGKTQLNRYILKRIRSSISTLALHVNKTLNV